MRPGDIVRFAMWEDIIDINDWSTTPKGHMGLLIEHDRVMRLASILHGGQVISVRIQLVEKAGKKDYAKSR